MRFFFPAILFAFFALSCAQVLSPDGGPKDTQPPKVLRYLPDSAATNFHGKKIVLRFNEYVQLSDVSNQVIVSPQLKHDPKISIRKKDVVVEIDDTLMPNTTYTISFGNAIRDITEGNVLDNFHYVFSTGPTIDSLMYSGKVVNASTLAPEKGVLVMLYNSTEDSAPYKRRPYYFTKSKADGSFLLTNLRAGTYKVFALDDKSQDYLYNTPDERIAFPDSLLLHLSANVDSVTLHLFSEEPVKQRREKVGQPAAGHISLTYALPLKNPQVEVSPTLPANVNLFVEKGVRGDSLNLWLSAVPGDSLKITVKDETLPKDDVIRLKLAQVELKKHPSRTGVADPRALSLSTNLIKSLLEQNQPLVVSSNNPVSALDPAKILVLRGRDTLKATYNLTENKHRLIFNTHFEPDSIYQLFLEPGAITDWFGQKSDTLRINFSIRSSNDYGSVKVSPSGLSPGNYLLRLVNDKDDVIRESVITGNAPVLFDKLLPGEYRIKLVADENKNGKWDTGNYLQHRQPEKVIYYASPVKVRAGWDLEIEWKFK